MSFYYGILDKGKIVITVIQSSEERDDIVDKYVKLDVGQKDYTEFLFSRWNEETSQIEFPPSPNMRWVAHYSDWRKVGWEEEHSSIMLNEIFEYYYALTEDEKNAFHQKYLDGNTDIKYATVLWHHQILRIFRDLGLHDDRITDPALSDEEIESYYT